MKDDEMDAVINTIRNIESGKVKINRTSRSIRSNETVNGMLERFNSKIAHLGLSKIPQWEIIYSLLENASSIEPSKVKTEVTRLQNQIDELQRKYEIERDNGLKNSENNLKLYARCKELEKRIKEMEGGKGN